MKTGLDGSPPGSCHAQREVIPLDRGWKFNFGHSHDATRDFGFGDGTKLQFAKLEPAPYGDHSIDGTTPGFDDADWESVDLPHDWSFGLPYDREQVPELGKRYGYKPVDRSCPETSIGWYRRSFALPGADEGKILLLTFESVFRNSMVWVNGFLMGRHWGGYGGFEYDISDYVRHGDTNIIAVRVDAGLHEGWFYEGAGILGQVAMIKTHPLHVEHSGPFIVTSGNHDRALLRVRTRVLNETFETRSAQLDLEVVAPDGEVVATDRSGARNIGARTGHTYEQNLIVRNPCLWSVDAPHLHTLVARVVSDGDAVDQYPIRFGIRYATFDPERGFFLNGDRLQIKGACIHQNFAGVGAAIPEPLHRYRLSLLKEMGANAVRSHYPFCRSMLRAADELGVLVVDETRAAGSTVEALGQLEWMIVNHRNHPCIVLWSLANEEGGTQRDIIGKRYMRKMAHLAHRLDPSRPVSAGVNAWGQSVDFGFSEELDVMGFNYSLKFIDRYHRDHPGQPLIGTEVSNVLSARETRVAAGDGGGPGVVDGIVRLEDGAGGYHMPEGVLHQPESKQGLLLAGNVAAQNASAHEAWQFYAQRAYLAGSFFWTGFDYKGETWPIGFPNNIAQFGAMDFAGFPKDIYWYYRSWWTDEPVLHIAQHWTWPGREDRCVDVLVYGNADEVSLYRNGVLLGRKEMPRNGFLQWRVDYAPGTLSAIGWKEDEAVSDCAVRTAGDPRCLRLVPDKTALVADGGDLAMVRADVVDENGSVVPHADDELTFTVAGNATILGVGNGNPASVEPESASRRRAFNGKALVIVRAGETGGTVVLTVRSPGLQPASVSLTSRYGQAEPLYKEIS